MKRLLENLKRLLSRMSRLPVFLFNALAMMCLCSCSDGRPDSEQARRHFEKLYPDLELVEVKNKIDEVVACSFEFSYRRNKEEEVQKIELQFMESDDGDWGFRPEPPAVLP